MTRMYPLALTPFSDNQTPNTRRNVVSDPESSSSSACAPRAALHLVNETVAFRRQVLRLVIDDPASSSPVDQSSAESRRVFVAPRPDDATPITGNTSSRLVAARVGVSPVPGFVLPTPRSAPTPTGAVRREMMAASCLSEQDARMILARRTAEAIEGGTVARLAPVRRQGLERLATCLGLRAFDASLVIAIAQDAARTGEAVDSPSVNGRLSLVGAAATPQAPSRNLPWGRMMAAAALIGAALGAALVQWVLRIG